MRYMCPVCKSELTVSDEIINKWKAIDEVNDIDYIFDGERLVCDICINDTGNEVWMNRIPDFETPDQYEKRTGKKWNGVIYTKCFSSFCKRATCEYVSWSSMRVDRNYDRCRFYLKTLCANSPEPPPDDFVPEEKKQ